MRTYTETRREGEDVGPVDWTHSAIKESDIPEATLREIEADPSQWQATTDGGWPRVGWGDVLAFRMYDGWPYWKPMPSVLINSWAGADWHCVSGCLDVRKKS